MAQLTVRNVDAELLRRLKRRAVEHHRSAEAEHRAILEMVLRPAPGDFWRLAAQLREETSGRKATDSTALIREARDRNHRAQRG